MSKTFKLTNNQKKVILGFGYKECNFNQIEECVNNGIFTNQTTHKQISWQTAIKRVGSDKFLKGISKASLSWSAWKESDKRSAYFGVNNTKFNYVVVYNRDVAKKINPDVLNQYVM